MSVHGSATFATCIYKYISHTFSTYEIFFWEGFWGSGIILIMCLKEWLPLIVVIDHVLPLKSSVSTLFRPYFDPISTFFANPGPIQWVQDLIFSGIILIVCVKEWLCLIMVVDRVLSLKTSVSTFFHCWNQVEKRLKRRFWGVKHDSLPLSKIKTLSHT